MLIASLLTPGHLPAVNASLCGYTSPTPTITKVTPKAGTIAGGMHVTITGDGFCNGLTGVFFGSTVSTSGTFISNTQIVAVAPAHVAGTVDITVVTAGGTSAISVADKFKYVGNKWCAFITLDRVPTQWFAGHGQSFVVTAFNCGTATWLQGGTFPIDGSIHFTTKAGGVASKAFWLSLKYHEIRANTPPNGNTLIRFSLTPRGHGRLFLEFVMIQVHRFFFDQATRSPVQFFSVSVLVH